MKIFETPRFFRTIPLFYQPLPFYEKNLTRTVFGEYYENSTPPSPIYKRGASNYGSRVKMSKKNNAISKKLLPFQKPQITP